VHSEGDEREEDDATEEARGVGVDEGARAVLGAETEAEADTETGDALAGVLEGVGADLDMPLGLSEEVAVEDEDEVAVVLAAFRAVRVEDLAGA
jgi:hypothetical protein